MTRVAEQGLTYNRFHVTALCSPTRAALLTGRNHHTVGFGSIGELPGPFPGYTASVPKDCASFVRVLQGNGYSTGGFGKWHLTPDHLQGAAGPFDRWPNAWGFDRFWGFLGGETGQYDPLITQDNTTLGVPERQGGEYYLPDDLTDQAVRWLHEVRAQDQEKPWFMYYSTGCAHAPHQVAVEWSEKYRGKFDQGWDTLREETFERQKQLGVIPADAELTPRPDALPAWDSLSESEQKLYARQMEVYAGYQENADWNVGRLLDAVDELGELENTLVLYIFGDNGASLEGTITGSFNELTMQNGIALTPGAAAVADRAVRRPRRLGHRRVRAALRDRLGVGREHAVPVGQAGRLTPRRHPQPHGRRLAAADHGRRRRCGRSSPTASTSARRSSRRPACPRRRSSTGSSRSRWRGRASSTASTTRTRPSGTRCSTSRSSATARSTRTAGGPPACSTGSPGTPRRRRWRGSRPARTTRSRTRGSCTTCRTTSARRRTSRPSIPEKLAELKELFWQEAEKHNVLPLLAGFSVFFGILPPMPTITTHTFYGDVQNIASGMIPRIYGRSYAIEAELVVPEGGAEGVIVAEADEMGGFSLWVDENGLLHHSYSMMGVEQYKQVSTKPIPTGDVTVRMQFDADRQERSAGGNVSLYANDEKIGEGRMEKTVFFRFSGYSGMDIGRDNGLVVDRAYEAKAPYAFTGTVKKVVFDLKPGTPRRREGAARGQRRTSRPRTASAPSREGAEPPAALEGGRQGESGSAAEPDRASYVEVPARAAEDADGCERDRGGDPRRGRGRGDPLPHPRPQRVPEHRHRDVVRAPDGDDRRLRRRRAEGRSGQDRRRRGDARGDLVHRDRDGGDHLHVRRARCGGTRRGRRGRARDRREQARRPSRQPRAAARPGRVDDRGARSAARRPIERVGDRRFVLFG